jgi:hypothetical protein
MRVISFLSFFIPLAIFGNEPSKKWIPIHPFPSTDGQVHYDSNHSTALPAKTPLIQKMKVIKNLLDQVKKDEPSVADEKNWYSLDLEE